MRSQADAPTGWRLATLGEIARIEIGRTPARARPDLWDPQKRTRNRWATIADMRNKYIADTAEYISDAAVRQIGMRLVEKGTPLMSFKLTVGRVAVPDVPVYTNEAIAAFYSNGEVDPVFLVHALPHVAKGGQTDQAAKGQTLNLEKLRALLLLLPPLLEQRTISDVLSCCERAVQESEKVLKAAERLRHALLHDLLTRGTPGWHSEWKHVPGIGTIPASWNIVPLHEVADVQTGRSVGKRHVSGPALTLPYLSVANVKDGYLDLGKVKTIVVAQHEVSRFALKNGDVLFTEGGDPDKLGRGCVWNAQIEPCLHQNHVFAVRPFVNALRPEFLATYAASWRGKAYFLSCAKQTTNLASINSSQLKQFPIALPPLAEQDMILTVLGSVPSSEPYLQTLQALKVAVADALLSGRVRVPVRDRSPALAGAP